jgi:hypothetical protein
MNEREVERTLYSKKVLSILDGGKIQLSGSFLKQLMKVHKHFIETDMKYNATLLISAVLSIVFPDILSNEEIYLYTNFIEKQFLSDPQIRSRLGI